MRTYSRIIVGLIIGILVIISMPLTPTIPINEQSQNNPPWIKTLGSFEIEINPLGGYVAPGDRVEINGTHQYIGSLIAQLFPHVWLWQYTTIDVIHKPDWLNVTIPKNVLLSNPDGRRENFSIFVFVSEDAPSYEYGLICLDIITTKFICIQFPFFKRIFGDYMLDHDIIIQSGFHPSLMIIPPPLPVEMRTNSVSMVNVTITNTGNARSILDFNVTIPEEDQLEGWSVVQYPPILIDFGETLDIPFVFHTPVTSDYYDEFVQFTLNIKVTSAVEGESGPSVNYSIPLFIHCLS
jgi:hypothetical protein